MYMCAQVLPPDVLLLAEPSPEDLLAALELALGRLAGLDPHKQHARVCGDVLPEARGRWGDTWDVLQVMCYLHPFTRCPSHAPPGCIHV